MFMHSVYFWLKPELTDEQRAAFEEGLRSLGAIEQVKSIFIGKPVYSERPVVDSSYSYALIEDLGDQYGHDTYQSHPIHLAFVRDFSSCWTQIKVYDATQ